MGYVVVTWPEIQHYMGLPGFDENAFLVNDEEGLEKFGSSAYFVDEDWLNDSDAEYEYADEMTEHCFEELNPEKEYDFPTPVKLSENRIAKKFWLDEDCGSVRIEIWQTFPDESWVGDIMLADRDSFISPEDVWEIAYELDDIIWDLEWE